MVTQQVLMILHESRFLQEKAVTNTREKAVYQAGHIWPQMFVPALILPSPSDWAGPRQVEAGK